MRGLSPTLLALAEQMGLFSGPATGPREVEVKPHVRVAPGGKRVLVGRHRRKVKPGEQVGMFGATRSSSKLGTLVTPTMIDPPTTGRWQLPDGTVFDVRGKLLKSSTGELNPKATVRSMGRRWLEVTAIDGRAAGKVALDKRFWQNLRVVYGFESASRAGDLEALGRLVHHANPGRAGLHERSIAGPHANAMHADAAHARDIADRLLEAGLLQRRLAFDGGDILEVSDEGYRVLGKEPPARADSDPAQQPYYGPAMRKRARRLVSAELERTGHLPGNLGAVGFWNPTPDRRGWYRMAGNVPVRVVELDDGQWSAQAQTGGLGGSKWHELDDPVASAIDALDVLDALAEPAHGERYPYGKEHNARRAIDRPWELESRVFSSLHGADSPWIMEISPVQRGRMSKAANRRYDRDRRARSDARAQMHDAWRSAIFDAYDKGVINRWTTHLSKDARLAISARESERQHEEALAYQSTLHRASRPKDAEIVKGAQFYDGVSGRRGTVFKVNKNTVWLRSERPLYNDHRTGEPVHEWKAQKKLLDKHNSVDIERMMGDAGWLYRKSRGGGVGTWHRKPTEAEVARSRAARERRLAMRKGAELHITVGDGLLPPPRELEVAGERCEWRAVAPRVGVLRVLFKGQDKALCIVAHDIDEGRTLARAAIADIRAGRSPKRGIMRRAGDLPLAVA